MTRRSPNEEPESLPRDGTGESPDEEPVRDRPAGPGVDGMNVTGGGDVTPGPPRPEDAPEQEDVVEERRRHTASQQEAIEADGA